MNEARGDVNMRVDDELCASELLEKLERRAAV